MNGNKVIILSQEGLVTKAHEIFTKETALKECVTQDYDVESVFAY